MTSGDARPLDGGVIGNCGFGALIDPRGRICWACLPHFDGDPVFHSLLGGKGGEDSDPEAGGFFDVLLEGFRESEQQYLENTAILVTTLRDGNGAAVQITDFAPRFEQFGRSFRPTMIVRTIERISGEPRIRIRLRPRFDYGARRPEVTRGSNHVRYVGPALTLRLTTDAPVSLISDEISFVLEQPLTLLLGPDESLTDPVDSVAREFRSRTETWWREFVRHLAVPFEWQEAVIRAAITLQLCSFEETGAVLAAMTTSIPEAPDSGRNWDYRFCWLRDSHFVVQALNRLGATRTMEGYLGYITNLAAAAEGGVLQPVYGIKFERELTERTVDGLPGYRGMPPVRVGNDAWRQLQNDSYGSAILSVTQSFFDRRLVKPGNRRVFGWLEQLGDQAVALFDQPDAGLWEFRQRSAVHTFSSVMCWAACDRLARIARALGLADRQRHWTNQAEAIRSHVLRHAETEGGGLAATLDGEGIDASLLLLHDLGFLDADDPCFAATVESLEPLRSGSHFFRYREDDFGSPATSFAVCSFWYIDAINDLGRREEARELFQQMLDRRNPVGLLSEDLDPETGELWGNFPQTYSMVGLINSALRLSRPWSEAF